MTERIISIDRLENMISVFGAFDENLHFLEKALQELDEKYEAKIAGARTAYENALLDLEHAKNYLADAEMEYKR